MPIEDCLNLYLNSEKFPKAFLTDKSICFAGGSDSTVGICQVSSPAASPSHMTSRLGVKLRHKLEKSLVVALNC